MITIRKVFGEYNDGSPGTVTKMEGRRPEYWSADVRRFSSSPIWRFSSSPIFQEIFVISHIEMTKIRTPVRPDWGDSMFPVIDYRGHVAVSFGVRTTSTLEQCDRTSGFNQRRNVIIMFTTCYKISSDTHYSIK